MVFGQGAAPDWGQVNAYSGSINITNITFHKGAYTHICLKTITGAVLRSWDIEKNKNPQLSLGDVSNGTYIIQLVGKEGSAAQKLVVQRYPH